MTIELHFQPSNCSSMIADHAAFKSSPTTPSLAVGLPSPNNTTRKNSSRSRRLTVFTVTEGSSKEKEEESIPSWARPDSDEPPPWARDEASQNASQQSFQISFFIYLLASAITAIAAIGFVFEYLNQKSVFGVLSSECLLCSVARILCSGG
ncbi:hypothetical protein ACSBR2_027010 [Camellia fascicularis]